MNGKNLIGSVKQNILSVNLLFYFLPISLIICFGRVIETVLQRIKEYFYLTLESVGFILAPSVHLSVHAQGTL